MLTEEDVARVFATSLYLKTVILFRLISSAIALVCMILMELNRKKFVAHKSLQLLLHCHGFWTMLLCISTFVESARQAYAHASFKEPSDILLTSDQCFNRMIPQFFGVCGSISSLLTMSLERFEASRKLSTYERSNGTDGIKYVALQLCLTLLGVFMDAPVYGFPTRVPHCTVISVNGRNLQTLDSAILTVMEIMAIYIFTRSLRQNESLHASGQWIDMTLSEKYQLNENIRVLRLLLPIVISHFSIAMFAAVGFFYFELAGYGKEFYPYLEETINIVYLQGIAMPCIFLYRYRHVLKSKRSLEAKMFLTNLASGEELISLYDDVITRGW